MNHRLFIALDLPDEIKEYLSNLLLEYSSLRHLNVNWESRQKMHLTLKFLGDTKPELLPLVKDKFMEFKNFKQFQAKISKFGLFSRNRIPQILWAGLEIDGELTGMVRRIESEFSMLGYKKEKRPFSPHITVLRIKPYYDFGLISPLLDINPKDDKFALKNLTLYESNLLKSGSVYTKHLEIELLD